MKKGTRKRLRWDRIGAVSGVLMMGLLGLANVVPDGEGYNDQSSEGLVSVSLVNDQPQQDADGSVSDLIEAPTDEATTPVEAEENETVTSPEPSSVSPVPNGPLPRQNIAPCSCSKHTMKLARNPYTSHQKRARTLPGSFFVKSQAELVAGTERGDLKRVPAVGRGYHLGRLNHSEPFLLASAKSTLEEMAGRFADAMEGTSDEGASIRITSLTRTQKQQSRLRRRNSNAYNGQSTHNYGASFDVAFIDRPSEKVTCGGPSWALQTILQDMQEKGRILVIPEGNCMHITPR